MSSNLTPFSSTLGHNRDFLWPCDFVGYWATGLSDPCAPKSLSRWLYCASWGSMSLRGNRNCLRDLRFNFSQRCSSDRSIPCCQSKPRAAQAIARDAICNRSRLFRPYLDHDFRCQVFLFDIFQKAHQSRDQNSYLLLDRGNHHFGFMAIFDLGAAHLVQAP